MCSSKTVWICLLLAVFGMSLPALAIPSRLSSQNGQGSPTDLTDVDGWDLVGRSIPIKLTASGKVITMSRQVICANAGDRQPGGYCGTGEYLYLFQIQSTSTDVPINIGNLAGFTPETDGVYNYGVMICNDPSGGNENNDMELCTEDPNNQVQGIGITFKQTAKNSVQFTIPSFPDFPAGIEPEEGQGLTLFVITQQGSTSPLPLPYPSVGD